MISLNAIVTRLQTFAESHYFIQKFTYGNPDELDIEKLGSYPALHVVYNGADYDEGTKTYNFELYLIDLPDNKLEDVEQRKEIASDAEQCLEDILADIAAGGNVFYLAEDYEVTSSSVLPIYKANSNVIAGALLDISIQVPHDRSACNLPIDGVEPEGGEFAYARRGLLRMLTINGATDVLSVNTIRVPNGTLVDNGNGDVTLTISGAGGGDVSSVNDVEPDLNGNVALDTDDIPEGATNVYYTNARVDAYLQSGDISLIDIASGAARLSWNDTEGTLDLAYANGVTLQLGQEEHFYAKATEAISDGEIVMFAGAQGSHLLIARADMSDPGFFPEAVIGVATQDFALNDFGYVTSFGKVRGLDLSAYSEGDLIYLDPSTPGGYTTSEPTPPDHIILVAAVAYAHSEQGTLFVRLSHKPDTDEVPEGSSNLYYTDARVDARVTALGLATTSYVDTEVGNEESARITADASLQSQINTAAGAIATNTGNITQNATDISTLDGVAVKSVNAITPVAGAVTLDSDDISEGSTNLYFTSAERTKLTGIETGAQVNVATDLTHTASALTLRIESSTGSDTTLTAASATLAGVMTSSDRTKLDGIETGAEVNPTASEIKTAYESNADTNAYTDAEKSKLAGIAAGAEVNVNADWNAVTGDAEILNKPTIPAQFFGVLASGSTAYTLNTPDAGRYLRFTASSAVSVTIPVDKFQTDDEIVIEQAGTGQVEIIAASGVTLNNSSANTKKTAERYAVIALKCVATNVFTLTGERELV